MDRPVVELHFAGAEARRPIDQIVLEAPAGGAAERTLDRDAAVWAIQPSPGPSARSLEVRARRPDGAVEVLLWMPRCLPEWTQALVPRQPVALPAGTTLRLVAEGGGVVVLSALR